MFKKTWVGEIKTFFFVLKKDVYEYMRLSKKEIQVILRATKEIYGEGVEIYLFGSRINDEKKGGDIDLLVRGSSERKGVLARIRMLARLKYFLGDQKIDIIGDHEDSPVAREALMTGIRLVSLVSHKNGS